MPIKRRNNGRAKKNCGHTQFVRCQNCFRAVPKDKAIKRFSIRNIIDSTIVDDVKNACQIDGFVLPKVYNKNQLCVSCALHNRVIRVRSHDDRKIREQPRRFNRNNKN